MYEELPNGFTGMPRRGRATTGNPWAPTPRSAQANVSSGASSAAHKMPNDNPWGSSGWSANASAGMAQGSFALSYAREVDPETEDGPRSFDPDKLRMIPAADRRWAWSEIDLSAIRYNTQTLKARLRPGVAMMAVVKADGYGHGAVRCAKTALNAGADYLGVATVEEAIALREGLVNAPILVLSEPPISAIPLLLGYKVMPSIYSVEFAIQYGEAADAFSMKAPYHLAVNTGMNRIGVAHDHVVEFLRQIDFHRALELRGTFTHFATADAVQSLDFERQQHRFEAALAAMRMAGFNPGIVHAANSAAIIRFPQVHYDMVRLGIALYGLQPADITRSMVELRPAMSVKARITDTRFLPMSEGVSYGLAYRSPGSVKICTVPIGYADGLRRGLSGRTDFIVSGQRMHQVGAICMDQCMFEVDMRTYGTRRRIDPQVGDEVIIVGREGQSIVTLDDMARTLDTITHEIAIGFGCSRMTRLFV